MHELIQYGDAPAVITEDNRVITYRELDDSASELANNITDRCLVFCLCTNQIGSLIGYVGCLQNKIVPYLCEASLDSQLLHQLLTAYKPDYIWCPQENTTKFPTAKTVFASHGYCLLKTTHDGVYPLFDELALLLTTSGSTGSPKLVRVSYQNLRANTESIVQALNIQNADRAITTLPMSYTYGLSVINSHMKAGGSIIFTEKSLFQREFWEIFKSLRATSFSGVPYSYEILDKLRFVRMTLPHLRTMTQAGGRLAPALHRRFAEYAKQRDINFFVMYGQTEATARISVLPPKDALEYCGSIGKTIPGGNLTVLDGAGKQITEPGKTGELVYRGENVTLGYATSGDDLSKPDEREQTLRTGDLATFDSNGYFYLAGRIKRFLKIFGNRINLDEIQLLLENKFPSVEFACTGKDDHLHVYTSGGRISSEVSSFLFKKMGIHRQALQVKTVSSIPRNKSGKIQYEQLNGLSQKNV